MKNIKFFVKVLPICFLFLSCAEIQTEDINFQDDGIHKLTIFVVPTKYPLDWDTPSTIYKTISKCYIRSIGQKVNYLLGHVAMRLDSPFLEESPYCFAQTSLSNREKVRLVYREKIGMGIMGATLSGGIEPHESLEEKLNYYTKKGMVTFITFILNDEAAKRAIEFVNHYTGKSNGGSSPSLYYNGAFWPRYSEEGGTCSSLAMSVLDVINLLDDEYVKRWRVDRKIPMELVGGKLNKGKKVKPSKIKRTHSWYEGNGEANESYAPWSVFEPNFMYEWIMQKRESKSEEFKPITAFDVPGLVYDATHVPVDMDAPLFVERKESNMFIDFHYEQIGK